MDRLRPGNIGYWHKNPQSDSVGMSFWGWVRICVRESAVLIVLIGFAFWYFLAIKSALVTDLFDIFLDASASGPPVFLIVHDEKWEENANFQASIVVQVPVDDGLLRFKSCFFHLLSTPGTSI